MPRRKHIGIQHLYKRRSQVYHKLRSRRLSASQYIVIHEPSKTEYLVIRRPEEGDWAVADPKNETRILFSQRTKNKVMELLAEKGPRVLKTA